MHTTIQRRSPRLTALLSATMLLLATAGCGDGDDPQAEADATAGAPASSGPSSASSSTPPQPTDSPTSRPGKQSLVGEYTFAIGADDFVARLAPDGTAKLFVEGELDAAGTYAVKGDELTVLDKESGVGDFCAGPGRYRWTMTGDQLSMTLIDEECPGRTELWTAGWTKVADQP